MQSQKLSISHSSYTWSSTKDNSIRRYAPTCQPPSSLFQLYFHAYLSAHTLPHIWWSHRFPVAMDRYLFLHVMLPLWLWLEGSRLPPDEHYYDWSVWVTKEKSWQGSGSIRDSSSCAISLAGVKSVVEAWVCRCCFWRQSVVFYSSKSSDEWTYA